jgi:SAM-dependent methyltransferase
MDRAHLAIIRANVTAFLRRCGERLDAAGKLILDIAPQDYTGAREHFPRSVVKTLDINPSSGADYIADLCENNATLIPDQSFDLVVCTEVLEHTLQPFRAVAEIQRMLRPGGLLLLSAPFNFRIHGPLPDCWRFTVHGIRSLLGSLFTDIQVEEVETPDRPLMPIHYTAIAQKPVGPRA